MSNPSGLLSSPRSTPQHVPYPEFAQELWGIQTPGPLCGPRKVTPCLLCALTYSRALRLLSGNKRGMYIQKRTTEPSGKKAFFSSSLSMMN